MSQYTRRRLLAMTISAVVYAALYRSGAGLWALLAFPYGLWEFYDGATRDQLTR